MRRKSVDIVRLLLALIAAFVLGSCASPAPQTGRSASGQASFAAALPDRPGLGTAWGETRASAASVTNFDRATPAQPLASAAIFTTIAPASQRWRAQRNCVGFGRSFPGRPRVWLRSACATKMDNFCPA
ncbi:MAG: hypothetical protein ABI787_10870 [Spartobacteria bacterium]